ncbi:PorP/SprF family type IX secretion system membrane protein [Rufibacter latericius]|uniref:Type IX secretion system membrane protein PorP/SprF n=1 Tax=Rufibacter latericius TaxID=2487040 RepID=A0A3M9MZV7_9BACT|nr:type IX secretion system membrane protein PorP/SprF [Rufibacter latericius]RNI31006.1 type IX secretion system membrane protein PorP/SprF [Rufibacter latericius]
MKRNRLLFQKVLFCCFFFWLPFLAKAQQRPQHTQYMLNNYLLNPALTGIEDYLDLKLSSRTQWAGIEGAPLTFYLSGHSKLGLNHPSSISKTADAKQGDFAPSPEQYGNYRKHKPHHGVGGCVLYDRIGPFVQTEVNATYAYHLWLTKELKLSGGASVGFLRQSFRSNQVTFADPADLVNTGRSSFTPNFSVGLWLYSQKFYVGASAYQLLGKELYSQENSKTLPHYFVTGAYKLNLTPEVALVPSVLIKWVQPLPVSLDLNVKASYDNRFWLGGSYRQGESFSGMAGLTLNSLFEVSYSHDFGTAAVSRASAGSHELLLGIRLLNHRQPTSPSNLW